MSINGEYHAAMFMLVLVIVLLLGYSDALRMTKATLRSPSSPRTGKMQRQVPKPHISVSVKSIKTPSKGKVALPINHAQLSSSRKTDRLQKVIAMAGVASRRSAENMILDGRVSLNGNLVTILGERMDARRDVLTVDGKRVALPDCRHIHWIMINKPKSYLTTMRDEHNRDTVLSIIPKANELRLVPVGGMDRDDTGLLLLTNDIAWIHRLTHPSFSHINQYELTVTGTLNETALRELSVSDNRGSPTVQLINFDPRQNQFRISVWLDQRSPQQLEEIAEKIGCTIISRKRVVFCGLKLKGLERGKWRELTAGEVAGLKASVSTRVKVNMADSHITAARISKTKSLKAAIKTINKSGMYCADEELQSYASSFKSNKNKRT